MSQKVSGNKIWMRLVVILVLLNLIAANPVPMFLSKKPSQMIISEYIVDPEDLPALSRPKRVASNYRDYDAIRKAGALIFLKRIPFSNYAGNDY